MGVTTYTPTGISHTTSVDFSKRSISQPVHIVQYDRSLPILAVSLYNNGQLYRLPESTRVSIRFGKPDKTFVYNPALGCNQSRTIVYFEITQQMTLFHGEFYPVIELIDGEKIANSSTIYIIIDKNPIQHDYVESTIEYKELIDYRNEAVQSAQNAKTSETNAKSSETNAANSASSASQSAQNAKTSETNAKSSETNAANSASSVSQSAQNAKTSETNAASSASSAAQSAKNAKTSETNAKTYMNNALEYSNNAKSSETNAKTSETNAKTYMNNALEYSKNAKSSETNAKTSETNAKASENNIVGSEENCALSAKIAKSYAVGDTDYRVGENMDNAKYYYQQIKQINEGLGGLIPMGTISFEELKSQSQKSGYMYNISDEFESDNTFKDGGNIKYPAGTNIYYTADGYWDCLAGSLISGIKGNEESEYRHGFVNITPENIGSYDKESVDDFISGLNIIIQSLSETVNTLISRITELEDLSGFAHLVVDDSGSELITSDNHIIILSI